MPIAPSGVSLLDRELEQAAVGNALHSALEGEGRTLVIRGDAGIGKTTLLRDAVASAGGQCFQVLEASADRLESDLSFGVCVQLFQRFLAAGVDDPDGHFSGAAALARAALEDGPGGSTIPGEDRTLPLVNGLYWLCANLAESGPLMIAVDDAHWGDLPSLRFLHFLTRRLDGLPVALVVALRSGVASEDASEPLAALAAGERVDVIAPAALGADAAARLVEAELGPPDDQFTQACLRLSGGNPLYLRELLRSARDRLFRPEATHVEALSTLRPERIAESVTARVVGLGDRARKLVDVAAVGGGRLHLRDAAALAGLDPGNAQGAADALAGASILSSGEPLSSPIHWSSLPSTRRFRMRRGRV